MGELQFRQAVRDAIAEEMRRDVNVFLMGEEVAEYEGAYKATQGLLKEFGEKRVIDTPISEEGFAGIGIGAAMNGCRPVIEFMTFNFSLMAFDQVINNAAKINAMSGGQYHAPIVFRGPTGNAGQLGQQHSQSFDSWYANTPGLKVVEPSNPKDCKGLLKSAIRDDDPVIFMESEVMYGEKGEVPDEEYLIPLGQAEIKRKGEDVTIVSFGKMMKVALGAADELQKDGTSAEVIDLRTIRPLDYQTIVDSVKKTNRLVFVEEGWPLGAISSEMAYHIQKYAFDYLDAPVHRVNNRDLPLHYAPEFIEETLPNVERAVEAAKSVLYMEV